MRTLGDNAKHKIVPRSALWATANIAERRFNIIFLLLRRDFPEIFNCSKNSLILKKFISRRSFKAAKNIDYGLLGTAFVDAYFLKNLLKCLYTFSLIEEGLSRSNLKLSNEIVDIGSGPGTASIAWLSTFPSSSVEITQIDPSEQHLRISKEMWEILFGMSPNFFTGKFQDWKGSSGTRLASYWLCGQDISTLKDNNNLKKLLSDDLIVIDYREVIDKFSHSIDGLVGYKSFSLSVELSDPHKIFLGRNTLTSVFYTLRKIYLSNFPLSFIY